MNYYKDTLEKAAKLTGLNFEIEQSPKSEAAYLYIWNGKKGTKDYYFGVRYASHEAMCIRSQRELEIEEIINWEADEFSTEYQLDKDGWLEFGEDLHEFDSIEELSHYMSEIIAKEILRKIN